MTDPMDDLRQASAEVSGVEVLSPAAQAVLDAYGLEVGGIAAITSYERRGIAAALRAAADQAFPLTETPWGSTLVPVFTAHESRDRLLAIATELENHQ